MIDKQSLSTISNQTVGLGGSLLAIAGLAAIIAGSDFLPPSACHALMLGAVLILASLDLPSTSSQAKRSAILPIIVAAMGFAAGVAVLWHAMIDARIGMPPAFEGARLWLALLGWAAILALTWRLWGPPLHLAGAVVGLCALIWPHGFGTPSLAPADLPREMAAMLALSWHEAPRSWLLDAWLSTILPFFLLGALLGARTFLASPPGSAANGQGVSAKIGSVVHALGRLPVPTMMVAALFMTTQPGIELPTVMIALLAPTSALAAWLWMMPPGEPSASKPSLAHGRDHLLIGTALAALAAAGALGFSHAMSAIVALGITALIGTIIGEDRPAPALVPQALAHGGVAFARLTIAIVTTGLVLAVLDRSGLPIDLARVLAGAAAEARFPLLILATGVAIGLGIAMPAIVAYLIAVMLIGPALRTVGIADLTIHLLLLFACIGGALARGGIASASLSKAGAGVATAAIGFAFAANPTLLLVPEALASVGRPDQAADALDVASALIRTGCMLLLLATAIEGACRHGFVAARTLLCIAAAFACMTDQPIAQAAGLLVGAALIISSRRMLAGRVARQWRRSAP